MDNGECFYGVSGLIGQDVLVLFVQSRGFSLVVFVRPYLLLDRSLITMLMPLYAGLVA